MKLACAKHPLKSIAEAISYELNNIFRKNNLGKSIKYFHYHFNELQFMLDGKFSRQTKLQTSGSKFGTPVETFAETVPR